MSDVCSSDLLDQNLHAMSQRGKRIPRWLPPETFTGKLPLAVDAVLIPRIAKRLRPVLLPAGLMPINHNLVVVSGLPAATLIKMLNHPDVPRHADRKSVVSGKRVGVSVDLGGRRIVKKKNSI